MGDTKFIPVGIGMLFWLYRVCVPARVKLPWFFLGAHFRKHAQNHALFGQHGQNYALFGQHGQNYALFGQHGQNYALFGPSLRYGFCVCPSWDKVTLG